MNLKYKDDCDPFEFTIYNTSSSDITLNLFDTQNLNLIPTTYSIPLYITGSNDYNFFVQSIVDTPKKIDLIQINAPFIYLNPLNIQFLDANGISTLKPKYPITYVDAYQVSTSQVKVFFDEGEYLMSENTKILDFIIYANQSVTFLVWYKELPRDSDLLSKQNDIRNVFKSLFGWQKKRLK
jgi:hypothetical protein